MTIGKTHAEARIVLIDHEPTTLDELSGALASAGYLPPEGIVNPSAVLTYLAETQPDLVVLELPMPGVDGYALLGSLTDQVLSRMTLTSSDLATREIPTVVLKAIEGAEREGTISLDELRQKLSRQR